MRILIVEDEQAVADSLAFLLSQEGHVVSVAETGPLALSRVQTRQPDLILLDLMLPGLNGLEVCRTIRRSARTPIIVVSARSAEVEKVVAFEAGADDYIVKPFSFPELRARIRAVGRRSVVEPSRTPRPSPVVAQPAPAQRLPRQRDHAPWLPRLRLEASQPQTVADYED